MEAIRSVRIAALAPIAVLVGHAVAGNLFGHEPYVDPIMHFLGGMAAAIFLRKVAFAFSFWLGRMTPVALDLLAFGLVCSAVLFWEFGEFASDSMLGTNIQRSVSNTMRDMILGVGGAIALLLVLRIKSAPDAS